MHATFKQTAVATGRIATESPNLQNIPVRSELGRQIRRAFIAGFPDHVLLVADYSQIELRVLAHITGDPGLREAFANDEDVHAATAAKVWGFAVEDVPRDLRARAKAINFGLAYGMNRFGLAQRLGAQEARQLGLALFVAMGLAAAGVLVVVEPWAGMVAASLTAAALVLKPWAPRLFGRDGLFALLTVAGAGISVLFLSAA